VNYTNQTAEDKDRRILRLQAEVGALKHALFKTQQSIGERVTHILSEFGISGKVNDEHSFLCSCSTWGLSSLLTSPLFRLNLYSDSSRFFFSHLHPLIHMLSSPLSDSFTNTGAVHVVVAPGCHQSTTHFVTIPIVVLSRLVATVCV
jgi:hypothetical protein